MESERNDNSIIMTFQYLRINNNKAVKSGKLNKDSVLIDTGSTCSVFNCKKIIANIQRINKTLRAYTDGGYHDSNLMGELPGFSSYGIIQS